MQKEHQEKIIEKNKAENNSKGLLDELAFIIRNIIQEEIEKALQERKIEAKSFENEQVICESADEKDLERIVTNYLHMLGVPSHVAGYKYLRTSIILGVNDPAIIQQITKQLYPKIAKQYNSTSARVERAIRHAIEVACNRGQEEAIEEIFGYTISAEKGKPTNSEFIATLADRILINDLK